MVKEFHKFVGPTCPFTTEHLPKVLVLQKYSSRVGMTVAHHPYHCMNQMRKINRAHHREINSSQGVLNRQGTIFYNILFI